MTPQDQRKAANAMIVTLPFGFIASNQLADLAKLEPLCPMLLRWHEGRQIVSAQEVAHLVATLEAAGWGLRDVCVTATRLQEARIEHSRTQDRPKTVIVPRSVVFDEAQCGGVFDGNQVTSDAEGNL